jgi:NAD(P)H-flavin reductase
VGRHAFVELTIDRLEDGEVSPYFHDVLTEGEDVELRGPFASFFVWRGETPVVRVSPAAPASYR